MHTIQTAIVFSTVLACICASIMLGPRLYSRTSSIACASVKCQTDSNHKNSIFELRSFLLNEMSYEIEVSCPDKAYRLGKGIRDSLEIIIE